MAVQFNCESCGQLLRVDESVAGRQVRCPKCKVVVSVPAPAPSVGPSRLFGLFGKDESYSVQCTRCRGHRFEAFAFAATPTSP